MMRTWGRAWEIVEREHRGVVAQYRRINDAGCEGTSATATWSHQENSPTRPSSARSNRETTKGVVHTTRRASLDDASVPLFAPPRGCGGGSAKSKATRILWDALKLCHLT
jgi:hypothetical protein